LALIEENHRAASPRLPIKVDLRDFAIWLERKNPFSPDAEEIPAADWARTLESFVAALIRHSSGGAAFSVSDLQAVFRLSAVLLVLDGLDEVAEIRRRSDVVVEIDKGVARLEANTASLQVIVTSRPPAFANSPGLPEKKFQYFSLGSLTRSLIDEYALKWLKARRVQDRDSAEIKKILKEKLEQPHIRDLARNPMQLAILLSLIQKRGRSLPDKRTALMMLT
jgi:predicted NACHT family NTPase